MKQKLVFMSALTVYMLLFFRATAQVTGDNVTYVEYDGGNFTLNVYGNWTEKAKTRSFQFKETSRDACCVYLYDASRSLSIQFNIDSKVIYVAQNSPTWTKLYDITNSQDVPVGYTKCAEENGTFVLPKNMDRVDIAYGANGKFKYKYYQLGPITFDNKTFGDPIPGVVKYGYYKQSATRARPGSED